MHAKSMLLLAALFSVMASADVIYLHCPTVFTKSVSIVKANYFKVTPPNTGPLPACNGLNVTIDGQPALNTSCVSNGLMSFNLSTPVAKTYTITGLSNPAIGGDGTTVSCSVRRSSFNVSITVPEFQPLLLPLVGFSAILLLRMRRRLA